MLGVSLLALGVANCSTAPRSTGGAKVSSPAKVDPKYGVKPSPRVVTNGKVPKGGGRAMVGKPYTVAGRKFTPRESDNYVAVGTASWYGSAFHGRKTANGEIFDKHSIAAAHPTLPLPSYVRVTNLSNNRSMVVRVNDRGPFHGNRLIDLSRTAAEALDFHRQGTARVKVEYVGRASLGGSDDRKLLATLNAGAPAAIPAAAPSAPAVAPVVPAAPVMVASAEPRPETLPEPRAEAPAPAPAVAPSRTVVASVAHETTESDRPLVSRTLVAAPAPRPMPSAPAPAPVEVAAVGAPVAASEIAPAPAPAPVSPAVPVQPATAFVPAAEGGLTELVREVAAPETAPIPPSRPLDLAPRRAVFVNAASSATHAEQPPARRSLVASLPYAGQTDKAGVFFEPMPLSDLTPQRFVTFGANGRQKTER
ncbi:rare lipoprotein A [Pseudochelatococcus lubricantis]|uniref:Endolytic peptidoglycan transglycosylase RlpA n=1 Tax=Pseudochelatococcus lubricantis TaxID=1538102 RepID=A0ABX0UTR2_9HYPH|nr:septal ring lytic transglycosylase RlpA family protein [Pseudochelatococcus lubricantis]NIJ56351.1 rare lipoprotein A [Pseudochelatococcus lubricantis]